MLGRPIDVTDHLVLACHTNQFPQDEEVVDQYGFRYFASGIDRRRLFTLYWRLVIEWAIDEDELRTAVKQDKLKEMLMFHVISSGSKVKRDLE